jgi:hypothetical protein
MYSLSLLEGYRLVELECYNGSGDDIIITHGYTLVSDLKLDDVLKELKESAFTHSSMPVILSIENHLDKNHQNIMAKKNTRNSRRFIYISLRYKTRIFTYIK